MQPRRCAIRPAARGLSALLLLSLVAGCAGRAVVSEAPPYWRQVGPAALGGERLPATADAFRG
jgi:hypothetical protein